MHSTARGVALVTGASRGVGRGIATSLHDAGYLVYATGRTIQRAKLPQAVRRIVCDHTDDTAVERAFGTIDNEQGRIDVLVNSVWGGYDRMCEHGRFTWTDPFWEQPRWRWDSMMTCGVRAAFVSSQLASRRMINAGRGLIINISYWAAQKYVGNTLYGISKAATDKLTFDAAHELRKYAVAVVSLYPGLVRTESVVASGAFDLTRSESAEFVGRAVAALASDPDVLRHTGHVLIAAELAREYEFTDIDGGQPPALRFADA